MPTAAARLHCGDSGLPQRGPLRGTVGAVQRLTAAARLLSEEFSSIFLISQWSRAAAVGLVTIGCTVSVPGAAPRTALGAPHFVDETTASGLAHVYDGDATFAVGGGIAVLDCNGDGKPDLYIAGGSGPAALYRNDSPVGGALKFTRLADPQTDLTGVNGAYPIDIDGDGRVDLAVLRNGDGPVARTRRLPLRAR